MTDSTPDALERAADEAAEELRAACVAHEADGYGEATWPRYQRARQRFAAAVARARNARERTADGKAAA